MVEAHSTSLMDTYGKIGNTTVVSIVYPSQRLGRLSTTSLDALIEDAEKLIKEANYIQACEKYYKVMEEIVKKLAELYQSSHVEIKEIIEKVKNFGFWYARLLEQATKRISKVLENKGLDKEIPLYSTWEDALRLHRDCFHEQILAPETIREKTEKIKLIYTKVKELLSKLDEQYLSMYDQDSNYFNPQTGS